MLPVNLNQLNQHRDKACRFCEDPNTPEIRHVREEYTDVMNQIPHKIKYEDVFKEQVIETRKNIARTTVKIPEIFNRHRLVSICFPKEQATQ